MDELLVALGGTLLIAFTAWFFFGKKDVVVQATDSIDIDVRGGYNPSTIQLKRGKEVTISFLRTDPSSCLEEVVLPDFRIRKFLPVDEKVPIKLKPTKMGTFRFECGMNMYHGKIIVTN